jgi:hypothetical protein
MFSLLVQFIAFRAANCVVPSVLQGSDTESLAQNLMRRADACAGRDPRQSAELRDAAKMVLSVTR